MTARAAVADHRKKVQPHEWREVHIAVIRSSSQVVACSCGWEYAHARKKPRDAATDRHLRKRHGGQAMFL